MLATTGEQVDVHKLECVYMHAGLDIEALKPRLHVRRVNCHGT